MACLSPARALSVCRNAAVVLLRENVLEVGLVGRHEDGLEEPEESAAAAGDSAC